MKIDIGDILYFNTTGAFKSKISLKCEVIDIGKMWIWIHIKGCLAYNNVLEKDLSKKPLYKVANDTMK